ncbi:unnamed protein product [Withania somnifera]
MGYIKLACPVTHVWYLKRLPSYIANLLDKPLKELEGLVYCDVLGRRNCHPSQSNWDALDLTCHLERVT